MCGNSVKMLAPGGMPRSRRRVLRAVTAAARRWKRTSSSVTHWSTRCGGHRTTVRSTSPRSSSSRAISRASIVLPTPTSSAMSKRTRIELERHQQGHDLVGARLDRDLSEAAKRSGAPAQREQQCVAQQQGRVMPAGLLRARQREPRLAHRLRLQRQVDQRPILIRSGHRTHLQGVRRASGEHHPLPPARADQAAGRVDGGAHGACPRAEASRAKAAFQPAGASNRTTSKPRSSSAGRAGPSASPMTAAT